jgi:hypothetical protein
VPVPGVLHCHFHVTFAGYQHDLKYH